MFKKTLVLGVIVTVLLLVMAVPAMAGPGAPAAHGVDGKTFGGLVSVLATSSPGAVAEHVAGR